MISLFFCWFPTKDKEVFLDFLEKIYPKFSLHQQKKKNIELFGGEEDDVLSRFANASTKYHFNHYVRVTADNPLTCENCLKLIVQQHLKNKKIDLSHFVGLPYGAAVEVIKRETLQSLHANPLVNKNQRQHVTLYIHQNPKLFQLSTPRAPKGYFFPKISVTIDHQKDFELFCERVKKHDGTKKIISLKKIILAEN